MNRTMRGGVLFMCVVVLVFGYKSRATTDEDSINTVVSSEDIVIEEDKVVEKNEQTDSIDDEVEMVEGEKEDVPVLEEDVPAAEGSGEGEEINSSLPEDVVIEKEDVGVVQKIVPKKSVGDKNLPKLVGVDVAKAGADLTKMPKLPMFKFAEGTYLYKFNSSLKTPIKMYQEGDEIILKVGSEVKSDKQVQGIIKLILSYYNGCKWEFTYAGDSSNFKIKLK